MLMQLPSENFSHIKKLPFNLDLTDIEKVQQPPSEAFSLRTWMNIYSEKLHQMLKRSVNPSLKSQISGMLCI